MREEVKSTMDFVPVETMWGDRDIWLTIERGPEFLTVAKELSDYIAELPLTVEQNDKIAIHKRHFRRKLRTTGPLSLLVAGSSILASESSSAARSCSKPPS